MSWLGVGGPVDYARADVPQEYVCGECGASGVKLWRLYATFPLNMKLFCVGCAVGNQKVTDQVDAEGLSPSRGGKRTDKVGNLVPAVPDATGETFWGYMSVPAEGVQWWRRLPLRKAA